MKAQLREIVTGYDPSVLWFDGEWVDWWTEADGRDLYDFVRGLRPDLVVNNRVGKGRKGMEGLTKDDADYAGDFGTPEQEVPASGLPGVDWESCMTMNDTWGYKADDRNWKSDVALVQTLVDVASKGGNYLLNVGPTAEGSIPAPSLERLSALGRWMAVNGEAIYGTSAGPFASPLPFGRATARAGRVYLHVFDWPASGKLSVPAFGREVGRASLLARRGSELHVSKEPGGWSIALPARPPDATATVIVLEQRPARARCQPRKLA